MSKQPIEPGIMARALGAIGAARDAWFGPSEPMAPMVTGQQVESVRGRQFDYPVALNRTTTPRSTEAISFSQLRAFADMCDVLRIVIETRKDQMAKMKWVIKRTDGSDGDARCQEVMDFLRLPDGEHDWDTWLRMLLEEVLVTDAPALYVRRTNGGSVFAIEPLDGATIKRVLDEHGRTPRPPDPAYQQVLKGIPAIDYTTDELIYRPRNQRVWKVYGYSPVEQIIMTVNTALRRSVHVLQSYTEGNMPEALIGVPDTWTVDQIKEYQKYWDSYMEGDTAQRRKGKFVPGLLKYQPTKEPVLKDEFDEWLARVVCFTFSIPPTPFIKSNNRATAESAQEAAISEGLAPIMQWVANLMNLIIVRHFGYADIGFDWNVEKEQDPLIKAQIDEIYMRAGAIDPDEVRADLGRESLTDEQRAKITAARTPPPMAIQPGAEVAPAETTSENDPAKEAVAKAKKPQPGRIDPDRATVVKLEKRLSKVIAAFLSKQATRVAGSVTKAELTDEQKQALLATLSVDWDELVPDVAAVLEDIGTSGALAALDQISQNDADVAFGAKVTAWAQDRAAEMVGKKWVDGELVDNPNAEWVITDSTRDMVQAMVASATDEGLTMDELSAALSDSFAFSEERATMIARTETRLADSAGQMEAYVTSGVVEGTEWSTSNDDLVSDECNANADAGVIPLGETYPSGDAAPPAHPNCFVSGTLVSAAGVSRHYERWFSGMVAVISAPGMDDITVTPNHPVLTRRGWVNAGELKLGDDLVQCLDPRGALLSPLEPYDNYIESRIEQVSRALGMAGGVSSETMPTAPVDFHGDGVINGKVHVVRADRALADDISESLQFGEQYDLAGGNLDGGRSTLNADGATTLLIESDYGAAPRIVGGSSQSLPVLDARFAHPKGHAFATSADGQPEAFEAVANGQAVATDAPSYIYARLAGHVTFVQVTNLAFREFRGHVYNLETKDGWYVANGIVAHNCRCCLIASLLAEQTDDSIQETE